jgi:hypothetical protein
MLGKIKGIVQLRNVYLYNHIHVEVEKLREKLNISLHAFAYVRTPKFYDLPWLASPTPSGGVKKKPHEDPKLQASYM